jgi:hypothetical protein
VTDATEECRIVQCRASTVFCKYRTPYTGADDTTDGDACSYHYTWRRQRGFDRWSKLSLRVGGARFWPVTRSEIINVMKKSNERKFEKLDKTHNGNKLRRPDACGVFGCTRTDGLRRVVVPKAGPRVLCEKHVEAFMGRAS